ncbi:MAG: hypothetical protein HZB54_07980, partial [Deltaproteobacteria bacterium]|nr:hypothetical protein [Deltaproteobacteria bacterium]
MQIKSFMFPKALIGDWKKAILTIFFILVACVPAFALEANEYRQIGG